MCSRSTYGQGFPPLFCTVTVKVQVAVLLDASVAVQVTVLVPIGKVEPDAGVQPTDVVPQLSVVVGGR